MMHVFFNSYSRFLFLAIYIFINSLFVLKYGIRQNITSQYTLLMIYILMVSSGLYILDRFKDYIQKIKDFNRYFLGVCSLIFAAFILINIAIDGNALNADRWSALDISIKSILNLEYPYDKFDHMNGTSSNLPTLIYVGIPFYVLGDVGFLQVFIFAVLIFTVFHLKFSSYQKTVFLFLLLLSPAYFWELFGKSDLMSNSFIVVIFMLVWNHKFQSNYFEKPLLLAFFIGALLLTRAVLVIPLIVFLFYEFIRATYKTKITFVVGVMVSVLFLSIPILISLPSKEIILRHNPINNQTMHSPFWVMLLSIFLPFFFSLKHQNFKRKIEISIGILFLMFFYLFVVNAIEEGFDRNLYLTLFDISYFGILIPFLLFYFVENSKQ